MNMLAAMGQPMSKGGIPAQTVQSSTHQYPDGTMTYALEQAGYVRKPPLADDKDTSVVVSGVSEV